MQVFYLRTKQNATGENVNDKNLMTAAVRGGGWRFTKKNILVVDFC